MKICVITCVTLCTIQSSAYVPLCKHDNRSNLSSFIIFNATLYFCPSFSSSPNTQSVMYGIPATIENILYIPDIKTKNKTAIYFSSKSDIINPGMSASKMINMVLNLTMFKCFVIISEY